MAEIATVCPYCGCGCGLYLHVRDGVVVGSSPSRSHPVAEGRLCLKGWHAHEVVDNPRRLTRPLVRRGAELVEATWEEARSAVVAGLGNTLEAEGPQAIGVLGSARCTNEDNYALVRFARGTLQTPNIDCSLRIQCVPDTSQPGEAWRAGVSTGQIADLDDADLVLLVGSDPTEEHPAVGARIYQGRQRGLRVVAVSTRKHPLAGLADVHLPVRPGGELRLIASLLHVVLAEQGMAGEERPGGEDLRAGVADVSPEVTAADTGVSADLVRQAAGLYLSSQRAVIVYSAGLALSAQSGAAVQALHSLAALGSGGSGRQVSVLSLLCRNNLQGCRDMGVAPDVLPGYASLGDDAAVQRFEQAWQCELARGTGLSAWEMPGRVRAMYVMGDDITRSIPDPEATLSALEALDFLVVQDIFMSPAASVAQVVLPAASFAEQDGTWTNLERRVQRTRRAASPPGEAREDWRIIADVSRAMGKPFPYEGPPQIFEEISDLLPIYAGVFYPPLAVNGGIRWATPEARDAGGPEEARLRPPPAEALAAPGSELRASDQYPLLLAADPTLRPWDGEVMVSQMLTVAGEFTVLIKDYPDGMLCLNPEDAKRFQVRGGRPARVVSPKGECQMQVRVTDEAPPGVALVPHNQATRLGIMEISTDQAGGRPLLAPTPISVGPAE